MNEIKCIFCDKELGKYVLDGYMDSPLGKIPCSHMELDYRKTARLFWSVGRQHGHLCKKCARQKFPEGKAYTVKFMYHGKETTIFAGRDAYGEYLATRAQAEARAQEMNDKNNGSRYWVEEHKL